MRICSVQNCANRHDAKGYCPKHYMQVKQYGRVLDETIFDRRPFLPLNDYLLVPLGLGSKHGYALIDAEHKHLEKYNWTLGKNGYPCAKVDGKLVYLHRLVLPINEYGMVVDHINGNKLDNRKSNLQSCTHKNNIRKSKLSSANSTGRRGVWFSKSRMKYIAEIKVNYKKKYLGQFDSIEEASREYERAAEVHFGSFVGI